MQRLADSVNRTSTVMAKADQSSKKAGGGIDSLTKIAGQAKKAFGAVGIALGVKEAIAATDKMLDRSFKLQSVMGNLTISIEKAKQQTMGLVDSFTLAQSANNAVRLGVVKSGDEFANLSEAATKLGLSVGLDATQATENLITALGRQSPMILDNLGITLKVSDAQAEYAARLGKTAKQLTDNEKAEAFRVIAMERALQKSKEVELQVGGLAGMYQRLKVAALDALDSLLGGDAGQGDIVEKARQAYKAMDEELKAQVEDLGKYGYAQRQVEQVLRDAGVAQEDMAAALKATTQARRMELEAIEEQRKEAAKLAEEQHRQSLAKMLQFNIGELEHEQKMLEALGHTRKMSTDEQIDQLNEIWEEKRYLAELEEDHDKRKAKLDQLDKDREIAIFSVVRQKEEEAIEAAKKAAEARRKAAEEARRAEEKRLQELKRNTDEFVDLMALEARVAREDAEFKQQMLEAEHHASFERLAMMDREIERIESLGESAEFMYQRRTQLAVNLHEVLGDHERAEQVAFDEEIRRNKARTKERVKQQKEEEKLLQAKQDANARMVADFSGAMLDSSMAAAKSTEDKRKAFFGELESFAFSRGRMLLIDAAFHAARAVIAAVSLNPVQAAAEGIAAGIAAAKAAVFMTGAVLAHAGGGGFSNSGGGAVSGAGTTPSAPQSRGGGGSRVNVDQPLSPLDQEVDRRAGSTGGRTAAANGGTTIQINGGTYIGGSRAQVGQWLIEIQEDARRANGNLGVG